MVTSKSAKYQQSEKLSQVTKAYPRQRAKFMGEKNPLVINAMAHIHPKTVPLKMQSATTVIERDILLQPASQDPETKGKMGTKPQA